MFSKIFLLIKSKKFPAPPHNIPNGKKFQLNIFLNYLFNNKNKNFIQ